MNDSNAGRIEDKWIEFVVAEFSGPRGRALRAATRAGTGSRCSMRRVEVHASYVWLLAGAMVAWLIG